MRLVATSNDYLEQRVREGTFRKDLFYRLSEFTINLPPLRERKRTCPCWPTTWCAPTRPGSQGYRPPTPDYHNVYE